MQVKTGADILKIKRFAKVYRHQGEKFLRKFLVEQEIVDSNQRIESLAGCFAIKEAFAKALGTGIGQKNVSWHDFLIQKDQWGKPIVRLSGGAAEIFDALGGRSFDVSVSHEKKYVIATCVILCD